MYNNSRDDLDDPESTDPLADYVSTSHPNGRNGGYVYLSPRQRKTALIVGGLVVVSAGIIAASVVLTKPKPSSSGGGSSAAGAAGTASAGGGGGDEEGTTTTSSSLVHGLSPSERFRAIRDRIILAAETDESDLEDGTSEGDNAIPTPQYAAARWLSYDDPMKLHPDDAHLVDRYSLAVFWYATHEAARREDEQSPPSEDDEEYANWDKSGGWMTGKGICDWYGVKCSASTYVDEGSAPGNGRVTNLTLPSNDIRGPLPDELFRVNSDMIHLDLNNNSLTGTLPDFFREWRDVQGIFLAHNYIEGTFPSSLSSAWHGETLESLNLGHNWLEGTLPSHLGNLNSLRRLSLYENDFSGSIPRTVGQCSLLESLMLDENALTGSLPKGLYSLTDLTDLRLRRNKLGGTLSPDLADLTKLRVMYLDSNALTGTIPPDAFGTMGDTLEELSLYENALSGPLPPSVGKLDKLKELYLDHNRLTGPIPREWTTGVALRRMTQLFLMDNDLTGTLDSGIVGWEGLTKLGLNGNGFNGAIPHELGALRSLEYLSMENNRFSGALPSELGRLKKMEKFKVHLNDLTGTVPRDVCDLTTAGVGSLTMFSADCDEGDQDGQDPEIECECCTQCFESRPSPPPPNTHSRDRPVQGDLVEDEDWEEMPGNLQN